MLPFETGASRKRRLSRARPSGTSGHAESRCHARLRLRAASSASPETPNRGRMRSRFSRCSTSSLQKGLRPARTSSSAGWYSLRQASAKAPQSSLWPAGPRMDSASRATPMRNATSVPNTSKNSALVLIASLGRTSRTLSSCRPRESGDPYSRADGYGSLRSRGRPQPDSGSRPRRLHALRLEHLGGSRARQGLEQGLGGVALLGVGADAGGINGVVLNFRRQRAHEPDAFDRQDFADLVNAELRLALGHVLRHRAARAQFGLGLPVVDDPELVQQTG